MLGLVADNGFAGFEKQRVHALSLDFKLTYVGLNFALKHSCIFGKKKKGGGGGTRNGRKP